MEKREFDKLTESEIKELKKMLRYRAEKAGRYLLRDLRCIYQEEQ